MREQEEFIHPLADECKGGDVDKFNTDERNEPIDDKRTVEFLCEVFIDCPTVNYSNNKNNSDVNIDYAMTHNIQGHVCSIQ